MFGSTTGCSGLSDLPVDLPQLYQQFGINPANATDKNIVNDFRTKALRELKKIKIAWPASTTRRRQAS